MPPGASNTKQCHQQCGNANKLCLHHPPLRGNTHDLTNICCFQWILAAQRKINSGFPQSCRTTNYRSDLSAQPRPWPQQLTLGPPDSPIHSPIAHYQDLPWLNSHTTTLGEGCRSRPRARALAAAKYGPANCLPPNGPNTNSLASISTAKEESWGLTSPDSNPGCFATLSESFVRDRQTHVVLLVYPSGVGKEARTRDSSLTKLEKLIQLYPTKRKEKPNSRFLSVTITTDRCGRYFTNFPMKGYCSRCSGTRFPNCVIVAISK